MIYKALLLVSPQPQFSLHLHSSHNCMHEHTYTYLQCGLWDEVRWIKKPNSMQKSLPLASREHWTGHLKGRLVCTETARENPEMNPARGMTKAGINCTRKKSSFSLPHSLSLVLVSQKIKANRNYSTALAWRLHCLQKFKENFQSEEGAGIYELGLDH